MITMSPHHQRRAATRSLLPLTLLALTGLLVTACSPSPPGEAVVTVTSTVAAPPTGGAAAANPASPPPNPAPASDTAASDGSSAGAPAAEAESHPGKTTRTGPPTTITFGRPTAADPATAGGGGTKGKPDGPAHRTGRGDAPSGTTPTGGTDNPPESLSTDGNLIAAATSAAAAAGVAPANPDTPGPESGPECPGYPKYVDEKPTGLRSDVVTAWRHAVNVAAGKGITMCLNDGKRSRGQQQAQYDEYVREYGTQVADELVLPPSKSAHVVGIAVDVQPAAAYRWLQSTDGSLGFCRIYDNEAWHFEYNPDYRTTGCPSRLPEPER